MLTFLVIALFVNAAISFAVAFFWQAKVILTIFWNADWSRAFPPWKALGDHDGLADTFARFWAGELYPTLRRKWGKAVSYVVTSYVVLFVVVALIEVFAPGAIR